MARTRVAATLVVFAVYVALPTKNYYWDGVSFAHSIESASRLAELLHPNHLLYNFLGYGVYHALGERFRALYILQWLNAVFGAATVYVLFGLIKAAEQPETATVLLTGLFAFSGTWWRFATDADAYIPSVFFLTLTALLLLPGRKPRPALAGVSYAAAMLFHQLAVFFFPAAVVALWRQSTEERSSRRALRTLVYMAAAVALTLSAYLLGFSAHADVDRGSRFLPWITSHSRDATFSFSLARDAVVSLRSWTQLFLIGRLKLIHFTDPGSVALLVLPAAAAVLLAMDLARHGLPRRVSIGCPVLLRWALVWLGPYALFLFVWLPHNTFYKLFALPAILLLIASCTTSPTGRSGCRTLTYLVAIVATSNLAFGIVPYSRIDANGAIAFAASLRTSLPRGSVVYYWDLNTDDSLARYFNPQSQWQRADGPASIDAALRSGQPVWLETTAIDHFAHVAPTWLAARTANAQWRELVNSHHRIRLVMLRPLARGE